MAPQTETPSQTANPAPSIAPMLSGTDSAQPQPVAQPAKPAAAALGGSAPGAQGSSTSALGTPAAPTLGSPGAQQAAQPQAAPAPQQQAKALTDAHHSAFGRLASYLLGQQSDYSVDPQTGQIRQTPVPQKPGNIFRNIVTGAILGMAAGQGAHDFAGGAGQGGAAVIERNDALNQQNYERAQKQQQNQLLQQEFSEDKRYHDAQIAQMTANGLRDEANFNLQTQKYLDERNDRERAFQLQLEGLGATEFPVMVGGQNINGRVGNGKDLQKLAGSDLTAVQAPQGYHTLHIMDVDTEGLSLKDGEWVDENGKPVNLEDRTTHTLYELPDNIWNEQAKGISTGKDLNSILGYQAVDPGAPIHISVGDLMNARAKGQEGALKEAETNLDNARATKALRGAGAKPSADPAVNSVVNSILSSGVDADAAERFIAGSQLSDSQRNEARKMYKQLVPKQSGSAVDRAIASLSSGTANSKAILYDPQGTAHTVDSNLVDQYLASPLYKGWHK